MEDSERRQILLVDYDDDLLTRLKVLLTDEGYEVTTAWGRKEALKVLGSKSFDVILLSDHLPDTNGRELWRLLRRLPSDAELVLIRGSDPATGDITALLRDYANHCVLPRTTPAQIASAIILCLRRQAGSASLAGERNQEKVDD